MKKQKNSFSSKFEKLYKEALEDDNLFSGESDDVIEDYEDNIDDVEDYDGEESGEDVTITLSASQVDVLREILSQVDGEGDEDFGNDEDFGDDDDDDDVSDIEELGKEAVEMQKAPEAETARSRTKSGKASTKTGDLDYDSQSQDTEEKQYKFVKREKPQELKHKTTKGS